MTLGNKTNALHNVGEISLFTADAMQPGEEGEDPELGADAMMVRVDSEQWSNDMLLEDTLRRSHGLSDDMKQKWWDYLFEFSFSYTPSQPNRLDLCKYLIDKKICDPLLSSRACSLGSVVHLAAETGSLEGLKYAISIDPQGLFLATGVYAQTPLHCAAIREDDEVEEIIKLLCESGVNPNVLDKDGRTALFRATHPLACKALIEAGALADLVCMQGCRALGVFLFYGAIESAKVLIKNGAKINDYQTPNLTVTNIGSIVPKRTPFGLYALGVEKNYEHKHAFDLFLMGADPFIVDSDGFCPFNALHPKARAKIEEQMLQFQVKDKDGFDKEGNKDGSGRKTL